MRRGSRARGITLIELLVVLAALVLLVAVMSQLRPRPSPPYPLGCSTNLAGIGKAIWLYSNDYRDEFPCAGGRNSRWTGRVADWQAKDRETAYGLGTDGAADQMSISASLYLLVKYVEVTPKSFVCRGDQGAKEFRIEDYGLRGGKPALADVWDFGPDPSKHCSYSYQMLYGEHKLMMSAEPSLAVAADRNPWMEERKSGDFSRFKPGAAPFNGSMKQARFGNTACHNGDGQNVLFLDTHVEFQRQSYCGLENDNIYTSWDGTDKIRGKPPKLGSQPASEKDSLLVNDPPAPRK